MKVDTPALSTPSSILAVNLDTPGKQHGFISLPFSSERAALSSVQVPLCMIRNGEGPTVAIVAGARGDEFEGQLAIQQLANSIELKDIHGCLLLLPALNPPACLAGRRLSPIDSLDINNSFTEFEACSITEHIAAHIADHIISRCDLVIELQSGGTSLQYAPTASVHFNHENKTAQQQAEHSMIAFGAPFSTRMPPAKQGNLAFEVLNQDKTYLSVYLGGGASASAENLKIALTGCKNTMVQYDLLNHELELCATRMLEVVNDQHYLMAPQSGLLELCKAVGQEVYSGSPIAKIHSPARTGVPYIEINADRDGILLARHHHGLIQHGDCVAILADEVQH